ncbi:MAG: rod shape-determining protein MreC [Muribaculaceae bacterium]|nr:rod shape-determining protein MreC [Muribaculaceae bacterium]
MRNLLNFLIKYSTWFVFTFYVLISCFLLIKSSKEHYSLYLSSANAVGSTIFKTTSEISNYFNLISVNKSLQESNARLENEVLNLRQQLSQYQVLAQDSAFLSDKIRFDFISASVINNSIRHPRNHFTIDKGASDGIVPGMGVVDQSGVVGIVDVTGQNTARVISLLNQNQHFSVKVKDSPFVGSLSWRGDDPSIAYMEEVPRHAKYHIGDTIVTSGYSTTFPEGINIGTVMGKVRTGDDTFLVLKIRLASNFKTLGTIRVIKDALKQELDSIRNVGNID